MSKKLTVLGVILLVVAILIQVIPELREVVGLLPFSMQGLLIGIAGIILIILGVGSALVKRL
jgi:hypothetical protein